MPDRDGNKTRAEKELASCLYALDSNDYYNGGQTVVAKYPRGSEARAQIVAEAAFWQTQIQMERAEVQD